MNWFNTAVVILFFSVSTVGVRNLYMPCSEYVFLYVANLAAIAMSYDKKHGHIQLVRHKCVYVCVYVCLVTPTPSPRSYNHFITAKKSIIMLSLYEALLRPCTT